MHYTTITRGAWCCLNCGEFKPNPLFGVPRVSPSRWSKTCDCSTFGFVADAVELELECKAGGYVKADPGVRTFANGDPGYPGHASYAEDIVVTLEGGSPNLVGLLTEDEYSCIEEALTMETDEAAADDDNDRAYEEARDRELDR